MESEIKFQSRCWLWWWNTHGRFKGNGKRLFRIKNELDSHGGSSLSRMKQLSENKATGQVNGVSDFEFMCPGFNVYIELKVGKNTQSPEQKEFQHTVEMMEHFYFVVYTLEEFQNIIERFI